MLKVGLVQLRTPASQAAALAHAEPLVREAAAAGAQLIATPEGTNILQRNKAALFEAMAPQESDAAVIGLRALADELGVWLLIGSALVRRDDGQCANRAILVAARWIHRSDLRQAAHVRRRPADRRAHPQVGELHARRPRGGRRGAPARSSASPSATTCASRRCTGRWRRRAPRC